VLPNNNTIPSSHRDAKKFLTSIGLPVQFMHSCIDYCIFYEGDYKDLQHCPKCREDRFRKNVLGQVHQGRYELELVPYLDLVINVSFKCDIFWIGFCYKQCSFN
jgi:hypothetical protein